MKKTLIPIFISLVLESLIMKNHSLYNIVLHFIKRILLYSFEFLTVKIFWKIKLVNTFQRFSQFFECFFNNELSSNCSRSNKLNNKYDTKSLRFLLSLSYKRVSGV